MKYFRVVFTLLLCIFICSGCQTKEVPSVTEISLSIKEISPDTIDWAPLDKSGISNYFVIPSESIKSFSGYINPSEEKFDMIAVFEYEDSNTRETILSAINTLTTQMSNNYRFANESEVSKISDPIIAEIDNTIILCIMNNHSKINDYLLNELNAEIIF